MDPPSNIKNVFSQPTLLVKVGPEKREYYVHKSLATQHSRYFRDVTQSRSGVESKTADIVLPEVDPIIFEAYVHWLYRQQLLVDQEQSICWSMVTLYEFANQFLIPALKNAIVHELTRLANSQPIILRYSTVIFAFEKLPKESPILLLLSDIHCKHWTGDSFDEEEEDLSTKLPHDFLLRVMRKYALLKKSKRYDMKLNPADYVERRNRSSTLSEKGKQILNHSDRREG